MTTLETALQLVVSLRKIVFIVHRGRPSHVLLRALEPVVVVRGFHILGSAMVPPYKKMVVYLGNQRGEEECVEKKRIPPTLTVT